MGRSLSFLLVANRHTYLTTVTRQEQALLCWSPTDTQTLQQLHARNKLYFAGHQQTHKPYNSYTPGTSFTLLVTNRHTNLTTVTRQEQALLCWSPTDTQTLQQLHARNKLYFAGHQQTHKPYNSYTPGTSFTLLVTNRHTNLTTVTRQEQASLCWSPTYPYFPNSHTQGTSNLFPRFHEYVLCASVVRSLADGTNRDPRKVPAGAGSRSACSKGALDPK